MATENVKLGVCSVKYDGVDLGYTKGGVEVEVSTETYKVTVDQFGETEINENILKRSIQITCPLAETTLDNLVSIMPGASLVDNGTKEVVTVTETTPTADTLYTLTINGKPYTYTTDASPTAGEWATGLIAAINAAGDSGYVASGTTTVILTARTSGKTGTITMVPAADSITVTTPAVVGARRVDVVTGIGTDLLSSAKELILHPINAGASKEEDITVPKAATAGAINFAYRVDDVRVFNVVFMGYPDNSQADLLFSVGDPTAA